MKNVTVLILFAYVLALVAGIFAENHKVVIFLGYLWIPLLITSYFVLKFNKN